MRAIRAILAISLKLFPLTPVPSPHKGRGQDAPFPGTAAATPRDSLSPRGRGLGVRGWRYLTHGRRAVPAPAIRAPAGGQLSHLSRRGPSGLGGTPPTDGRDRDRCRQVRAPTIHRRDPRGLVRVPSPAATKHHSGEPRRQGGETWSRLPKAVMRPCPSSASSSTSSSRAASMAAAGGGSSQDSARGSAVPHPRSREARLKDRRSEFRVRRKRAGSAFAARPRGESRRRARCGRRVPSADRRRRETRARFRAA